MEYETIRITSESGKPFDVVVDDDGEPRVWIRTCGGDFEGVYLLVAEVIGEGNAVEEKIIGVVLDDLQAARDALDVLLEYGYVANGEVVSALELLDFLKDCNDFHISRRWLNGESPREVFKDMTAQDMLNDYEELF